MAEFKILHDRPVCIGCAACTAVAPETWEMNADGKADIKGCKEEGSNQVLEVNELGNNQQAAEVCPVNCIHIFQKDKKII
ncbi:ferredoxin [Candidatus Woesearchaeota archaeon]|nr:ferredoxin [Candidatus Woesearchaeota archaeon]